MKTFTKEQVLRNFYMILVSCHYNLFNTFLDLSKEERMRFREITRNVKNYSEEKALNHYKEKEFTKSEFGYYATYENLLPELISLIRKFNVTKIKDLGCGPGYLMIIFKILGLKTSGIEIEQINKKLAPSFIKNTITIGDICKKFTVQKDEVVYFYEPIASSIQAKKFVDNLEKCIPKDNLIFYLSAKSIAYHLDKSSHFERITNNFKMNNIRIYKKI